MKKFITLLLLVLSLFAVVGCGEKNPGPEKDIFKKSEGVMTYEQYAAAALETEVTIEAFVQAKQSWWSEKGTFYLADKDGAYFVYELPCSEEEYNKLVVGSKIQVKGTKKEWSGEVEICDATWTAMEGTYVAEAKDLTANFADLSNFKNQKALFKGLEIVDAKTYFLEDESISEGTAFLYKWNGTGDKGNNDDLYFYVKLGETVYSFTVESYLCAEGTDVYKAVEALKVGNIVDLEGFVYYYEKPQVHVTKVTVK